MFSVLYAIEKMHILNGNKPYKVAVTASAMAHFAVPGYVIYSSTKAAIDRFADGYRWQLDDPRKLMLVYPIATRTKFFKAAGQGVPTPWPSQTSEEVARKIIEGIRKDKKISLSFRCFQSDTFLEPFPSDALACSKT